MTNSPRRDGEVLTEERRQVTGVGAADGGGDVAHRVAGRRQEMLRPGKSA